MSKTALDTDARTTPAGAASAKAKPASALRPVRDALQGLASLRVTTVLFSLSIVLIFLGTLAMTDIGLWSALDKYFRSWFVWVPFQVLVRFGQVFFGVSPTASVPGSFPFFGGWLLGLLLLINVLAAHAVRFKLSWKRSGILLIHAGLIVMMVSELVTGLFAVEARMTIAEGETVDFVDVTRRYELAFTTDAADPKREDVVVIPGSRLEKGGTITDGRLPVEVEVVRYMNNTQLSEVGGRSVNQPDVFGGLEGGFYRISERGEETGVDPNQREDAPAVRVTFRAKGGEDLGTHLLSLWQYPNFFSRNVLFPPLELKADGKTYRVEFRNKREYKPYRIHLNDFQHDVYVGTNTPRNYSSDVRLLDPERDEDRTVTISMNAPLRYLGETFYQSGFLPRDEGTVLQVVRNPGWLMPYVSCALVSVGMLIHFGLHLAGFLRQRFAT